MIGGPAVSAERVAGLLAELGATIEAGTPFDAAFGFTVEGAGAGLGRIDAATAAQFGIDGITLLAVRPDRYIGLRRDEPGGAAALSTYLAALAA